jgi:hypothetical protein
VRPVGDGGRHAGAWRGGRLPAGDAGAAPAGSTARPVAAQTHDGARVATDRPSHTLPH